MGNDFLINSVPNLNVVTNLLQLKPLMSYLVHKENRNVLQLNITKSVLERAIHRGKR